MEIVNYSNLTKEEKKFLSMAVSASRQSVSDLGHQVGCVIKCKNGDLFLGATNIRSRSIGSTCAERMAVDQMLFNTNKQPELCILIGKVPSAQWRKKTTLSSICTPCGVCLEMFRQQVVYLGLKNLSFICSSWDKKRILKAELYELFPDPNLDLT